MSLLPHQPHSHREDVWKTLAILFIGRDLDDIDYRIIVKHLRQSGLTLDEIEIILRNEVAPVFKVNLSPFNTVPELEGWSTDFISDKVREYLQRHRSMGTRMIEWLAPDPLRNAVLRERWQTVRRLFER